MLPMELQITAITALQIAIKCIHFVMSVNLTSAIF